ncbi:unnamed protein product [Phytophthora fragariaefolia]|uniref:Unnamed protein product n=1 Tax=Phytophthora fragariaefolia TaxID=1490495 RepID=A0A9W6YHZ7_9STRA|nr:unnamed protein product [Phytophthora fragariaefolia]
MWISSGNTGTDPFDNSRSHEHKLRAAGTPVMTTETQMILRAAPDALGAAGPAEHDANAPTPSEAEEKPPAPASKKHSAKKTPASEKPTTGAEAERKPPGSKKLAVAAAKKNTSASVKPTRKTTKTTASSKLAPKKPAVKKPAAKQLPKTEDATKGHRKTTVLPPKRMDVLLPGPHEEVSSGSSDTDTPNPGLITGVDPPVVDASTARELERPRRLVRLPQAPRPLPFRGEARRRTRLCGWTMKSRNPTRTARPARSRDLGRRHRSPVLHPGSPMSPKTVGVVARARALEKNLSYRDDPPLATPEPQVITNAGIDEGSLPSCCSPKIGST